MYTKSLTLIAAAALLPAVMAAPSSHVEASAMSTEKRGFSYHDNQVFFDHYGSDDNRLSAVEFKIEQHMVSPGQDPNNMNRDGVTQVSDNPGVTGPPALTFRAGRHGTSDVAQWWTQHVAAEQSAYNKSPGKLNFAFGGSLTLQRIDGFTVTIDNLFLGQGHSGTSNDWWVGGPQCQNAHSGCEVKCPAVDCNGKQTTVSFDRGSGCGGGGKADHIAVIYSGNLEREADFNGQ